MKHTLLLAFALAVPAVCTAAGPSAPDDALSWEVRSLGAVVPVG